MGQEPDDYSLNSIGSMNYLDVQARCRFNDRFEIYGGIDNINVGRSWPTLLPDSCKNVPDATTMAATTLACIEAAHIYGLGIKAGGRLRGINVVRSMRNGDYHGLKDFLF